MERCKWCLANEKLTAYHDKEWGLPLFDDRRQFEFLMMEVMQCGLNWNMMLQKRDIFRKCFENFNFESIAAYGEKDISRIMETEGMIRSERKIRAVINNASCFIKIREKYGSFSKYIWSFTDGKTLVYKSHRDAAVSKNELSDIISADLKKYGFRFLGSVTVYSHLQACGIINDHCPYCFRYKYIIENRPIEYRQ